MYNINEHNGLPSNHAYCSITDKYGYLWIATERGVVRYNGYGFKTFDLSSGMLNSDIWRLYEDKKGRIWFSSISDEMGYVYNGHYKKAYIKSPDPRIYINNFQETERGLVFATNYDREKINWKLGFEHNDTVDLFTIYPYVLLSDSRPIIGNNTILSIYNGYFYKTIFKHGNFYLKKLFKVAINPSNNVFYIIGNNIYAHLLQNATSFYRQDLNTGQLTSLHFKDEHIILSYYNKYIYIVTNKNFQVYTPNLTLIRSIPFKTIKGIPNENDNILTLWEDSLWNKCIGTAGSGAYIYYGPEQYFTKINNSDFKDYKYIGSVGQYCYWWSKLHKKLASVCNGVTRFYPGTRFSEAFKIISYNADSCFLLTYNGIYEFVQKKSEQIFTQIPYVKYLHGSGNPLDLTTQDGIFFSKDSFYSLNTRLGFRKITIEHDSINMQYVCSARSFQLTYDTFHHVVWLYGPRSIVIYDQFQKSYFLNKEIPEEIGIKNIEKISIDKFNNIYLKDFDKIVMFNVRYPGYKILLPNYELSNTLMEVYGNHLVVAGKFGISFCQINGPMDISKPLLYPNIKNTNYEYVSDILHYNGQILLNTDRALYKVTIPSDIEILLHNQDRHLYKLLLLYNNNTSIINQYDTFRINQKNLKLEFDIVNPSGNGVIKYRYRIPKMEDGWHDLDANELHLQQLTPGKYYKFSIVAHDDVWKSNATNFYLYIYPYWWQTDTGKMLIWTCSTILILLSIVTVIYLTQKIVIQKNVKRNLQLELELRAIYAQINPHFIFNTLNSALYLIKTKKLNEAYLHIAKFSNLLRSYIKSSRNKLISIGEEIENLKYYIELQQRRFNNKFDYEILVDKSIAATLNIPSLLLQPIVENAIEHGLKPKKNKGHLKIEFKSLQEKELLIVIEDNGIGREASKKIRSQQTGKRESYGNRLTEDLIAIFNKYEMMNIALEYTDKVSPLTGTIVEIHIKSQIW